jgi:hypothetical protein
VLGRHDPGILVIRIAEYVGVDRRPYGCQVRHQIREPRFRWAPQLWMSVQNEAQQGRAGSCRAYDQRQFTVLALRGAQLLGGFTMGTVCCARCPEKVR